MLRKMKKSLIFMLLILTTVFVAMKSRTEMDVPEGYLPVDTVKVKATIYKTNVGVVTADGFKIDKKYAGLHKIIAVSRDLKKKFPFGTRVLLTGAGKLDGVYTVKDVMHKKWTKKVDILVDNSYPLTKFNKINLIKLSKEQI